MKDYDDTFEPSAELLAAAYKNSVAQSVYEKETDPERKSAALDSWFKIEKEYNEILRREKSPA